MEKTTVTRTFSIGAISNRVQAVSSEDFSTTRRHSSAGLRALLWANNSKLFGCSLNSDSQSSLENTFPNILTPGSIPQFTIPNLSVTSSLRSLDASTTGDEEEESEGRGSSEQDSASAANSSNSLSGPRLCVRKAERSVSDPLNQRRVLQQRDVSSSHTGDHQCLDPASRAAFSLPHLPKITTPYGFITLSQSPHMANEEALLRCKDVDTMCRYRKAPLRRTSQQAVCSQRLSSTDTPANTRCTTPASCQVTAAPTDGKFKSRFREIIRKHFTTRNR
ncbi:unnamed protein product [Knipowitschia caucasica]|uniref:Uncharacterized protein n=1 Tax=Knipowitschia caucasica TaxID=637954 RepID=A0AAV2L0L4_KNICA